MINKIKYIFLFLNIKINLKKNVNQTWRNLLLGAWMDLGVRVSQAFLNFDSLKSHILC